MVHFVSDLTVRIRTGITELAGISRDARASIPGHLVNARGAVHTQVSGTVVDIWH